MIAAASGWYAPVLAVVAAGSIVTAGVRLRWIWRELGTEAAAGSRR
ncbi:hypothetical protein V2W30_28120 [Streptomyces sp. Q6]|uniref:Uncharacterized protein n=1 Tax=Streptomyces citrinus TaxID=3118173 RepID=A0ACD5AHW6_9ACTN